MPPNERIIAIPDTVTLSGLSDLLSSPMIGTIGNVVGSAFGIPGVGSIAQGVISPLMKPTAPRAANPSQQMATQLVQRFFPAPPPPPRVLQAPINRQIAPPPRPPIPRSPSGIDLRQEPVPPPSRPSSSESKSDNSGLMMLGLLAVGALALGGKGK